MRATAKALKQFAGGFGIPAYTVETVPDDVNLPYITYPLKEPEWNQKTTFYIQGWYRATDYTEMLEKADQIVREVGNGITVSTDVGFVVIYPETPLVQTMVDGDIRSFYINLSLNAFSTPGAFPAVQTPTQGSEEGETNAET